MEVIINREGKKLVAVLSGRLDSTNAAQFEKEIAPLFEGENPEIELDCAGMDYTSSQGLRMFLSLQKSVSLRHGTLVMTNMKPQVKEVFDITGFSHIITIK